MTTNALMTEQLAQEMTELCLERIEKPAVSVAQSILTVVLATAAFVPPTPDLRCDHGWNCLPF